MLFFKSQPKLPASFQRWDEVDAVTGSELLHEGPSVLDVRTFKKWLDAYERWHAGYGEYMKAEGGGFADDFDRRQHEHYTALFIQSGQWHAILLMLVEDAPEAERSKYLTDIDASLADLRKKIGRL